MEYNLEIGIKIGGFLLSLLVLIKGIFEYSKAQKWKKAELIFKEVKEFFNDFDIKRALIILDWKESEIELKANEIPGKIKLLFDEKLILSSLRTHKESNGYSKEEAIKGILDNFFDRLTMFDIYIEVGLFKAKDLKPYLYYWIKIFADFEDDRKPKEIKSQIWKYIDQYNFTRLRGFCDQILHS